MIFVTGGTGLIGSHLLYQLLLEGRKVKALKRSTSNLQQVLKVFSCYTENPEQLFNRIEWVTGDILDYFEMERIVKGVEEVYHCAAIVSFNAADRRQMISNNVTGTANVVNASLENGVKKLCHVSSVAALGTNQNGYPIDEQTNWVPSKRVTAYSESKFFSETEIWRGIEEGLDAVIVNPSIVLGPGNWNEGSPKLFKTVLDGLRFYTKGVTGYVDVKDVVRAMILLMEDENFNRCKNQRYLLNSENWSYQKLFNHIADALNKPRPAYFASAPALGIAWRTAALLNLVSVNKIPVTRETAAAAGTQNNYDGSKITKTIEFTYLPVADSIKQTTAFLLSEDKQKIKPS
ncbi:MAG: NAD-dependent epimerase/dehydratase family protein [Mariniphaga sp.]